MSWLAELVELNLSCLFARYGSCWYKGVKGIPTGGFLSVVLANITVYYALKAIIYDTPDTPKELIDLRRFIDDLGGLWKGTVEEFSDWENKVNENLQKQYGYL